MGIELKPAFISKLLNFKLQAKGIYSTSSGIHSSKIKGSSLDFYEHRVYTPFDEIKKINWKAYARTDKYLVKEYQAETNIEVYVVLDSSRSMGFFRKFELAALTAYGISYAFIRQYDAAGIIVADTFLEASTSLEHISSIYNKLDVKPSGIFQFPEVLFKLRRKLIIFVSDLMFEAEPFVEKISRLILSKNAVRVIRVLSKEERDFSISSRTLFIDSETNQKLTIDPFDYKNEFIKWLEEQDRRISRFARILTVYTDTPPALAATMIGRFLSD